MHILGHVHTGGAMVTIGDAIYIEASMMQEDGNLKDWPIVLRLPRR